MTLFKLFPPVAGLALLAGSAMAIDFGTNATINGTSYTVGGANSPVQRLGDALSFSLPSAFATDAPKTITLGYSVFATPASFLTQATEFGTGAATGSSTVRFDTVYTSGSFTETSSQTNTGTNNFPTFTHTFAAPRPSWNVLTTLTLTPGGGGVAKSSAYTANYQAAVPEPVSIATLGVGLLGLVARKRRK